MLGACELLHDAVCAHRDLSDAVLEVFLVKFDSQAIPVKVSKHCYAIVADNLAFRNSCFQSPVARDSLQGVEHVRLLRRS